MSISRFLPTTAINLVLFPPPRGPQAPARGPAESARPEIDTSPSRKRCNLVIPRHQPQDASGTIGVMFLNPPLILLAFHRRVMPASHRCDSFDFARSPGAWLVFVERSVCLQHRIDDSPRLFHAIFAGKQSGVSRHGVTEHALVSIHLF